MTGALAPAPSGPACPDCAVALTAVASGAILAHRCGRCRGVWLDPASFQQLCDEEASPPDEGHGRAIGPARRAGERRAQPRAEERVRYRACPICRDVMNRKNFARLSGVVIDVCRPHGAWFDRGELGAIRAFLREGGLAKYERHRRNREALASDPAGRGPGPRGASVDDVYDVLVGGDASWDVPSRIPRLVVAAFFGAAGAFLLWRAFRPDIYHRNGGVGHVGAGSISLYFAWRAFAQWLARRRR